MGVLPWLIALSSGIVAASFAPFRPWWILLPLVVALPVIFLRRPAALLISAAFLFFFLAGFLLASMALQPPPAPDQVLAWADGHESIVEAEVLHAARRSGGKGYLDLRCLSITRQGRQTPVQGRVRLFFDEANQKAKPGDRIHFRCRLRQPSNFGTPGEFNYPRHLAARDIHVTGYLKSLDEAAILPGRRGFSPRCMAAQVRASLHELIQGSVDRETEALLSALLIGDKGGISDEQRDILARGGVSHLFSISGMHLGLIGFYVYQVLFFLWRHVDALLLYLPPKRFLPLAMLPILWAYLLLTGEALPTQRAFLMAAGGALLWTFCYRSTPFYLLWSAAFFFLLSGPLLLFEVSFQMSFAGVLGIMLLMPHWAQRCPPGPKLVRWFCLLFLTTSAATLATLPLVLLHFHLLAPAALLTNLLAVPVVGLLVVPLGLLAMLSAPLWEQGAQWLLAFNGLILQQTFRVIEWCITLPVLGGWRMFLTWRELAAVFLLALAALLVHRLPWRHLAAMGLTALLLGVAPAPAPSDFSVIALSVGQGDATLLTLAPQRHILIDGGGLRSETFDVGERLLAPALGRLGVRSLEAVVLTHDHPDHRKGLHYILRQYRVGEFWAPAPLSQLDSELVGILADKQIPVRHFTPGWTVIALENPLVAVFRPDGPGFSLNDQSLVIYARNDQGSLLLTGDLESRGVQELLLHQLPGPVSLLKMPHHGSARSQAERLVDELKPEIAFVSAGRGNVYNLPAPSVVDDLERRNIPLFRTDTQGSLRFSTQGNGWHAQAWQRGFWRRVHGAKIAQ